MRMTGQARGWAVSWRRYGRNLIEPTMRRPPGSGFCSSCGRGTPTARVVVVALGRTRWRGRVSRFCDSAYGPAVRLDDNGTRRQSSMGRSGGVLGG